METVAVAKTSNVMSRLTTFVLRDNTLCKSDFMLSSSLDEDALIAEVRDLMPAWLEALEPASDWAARLRPAFDEMYRRCVATDVGFTRWTDNEQRS